MIYDFCTRRRAREGLNAAIVGDEGAYIRSDMSEFSAEHSD
jgi:ATP-dependent Clp protease ATP-binding subunit ClpA